MNPEEDTQTLIAKNNMLRNEKLELKQKLRNLKVEFNLLLKEYLTLKENAKSK
jgi:hypothetical protein